MKPDLRFFLPHSTAPDKKLSIERRSQALLDGHTIEIVYVSQEPRQP